MSNSATIDAMKARVRSILVADLKNVCRDESIAVSGPKNVLQSRIIARIEQQVSQGNIVGLNSMRSALLRVSGGSLPPLNSNTSASSSTTSSSRGYGNSSVIYPGSGGSMARSTTGPGLNFRPSPFYESQEALARTVELPAYPQHRNQVTINFMLSPANIQKMREDSSLRVLLYCAAKSDVASANGPHDVAFPSQLEVKVNESEVRANFKGLKNKPGSTRPADITAFITKQPQYTNRILVTYALTAKAGEKPSPQDSQGFSMAVMLVKKRSVDELVARIQRGKVIPKEKVVNEMQMRAKDPDIIVGDSVMNLKDPVSYVRIAVPTRSDVCSHHQCFDAASFLQLQEQAPQWSCPICNKTVSFEGLVVDKYFENILKSTTNSTYQVTVDPNGNWSAGDTSRSSGQNGRHQADSDDFSDDDLIEVVKPIKRESFASSNALGTPFSMAVPTPPRASPTVSNTTNGAVHRSGGQKRKSEVIDLTLDSDDDQPATKRPAYSTPNSLPDHNQSSRLGRTNGYQSYPSHAPPTSFSNRANGPLRFQIGSGSGSGSSSNDTTGNSGGGSGSNTNNTFNNNNTFDFSASSSNSRHDDNDTFASIFGLNNSIPPSRTGHRPSPLSGSALEPINLTESPPHRSASSALAPYSPDEGGGFGQGTTLPRFDFESFNTPPPIPASATNTRNANARFGQGQNPEQRAVLRQLANPFGD